MTFDSADFLDDSSDTEKYIGIGIVLGCIALVFAYICYILWCRDNSARDAAAKRKRKVLPKKKKKRLSIFHDAKKGSISITGPDNNQANERIDHQRLLITNDGAQFLEINFRANDDKDKEAKNYADNLIEQLIADKEFEERVVYKKVYNDKKEHADAKLIVTYLGDDHNQDPPIKAALALLGQDDNISNIEAEPPRKAELVNTEPGPDDDVIQVDFKVKDKDKKPCEHAEDVITQLRGVHPQFDDRFIKKDVNQHPEKEKEATVRMLIKPDDEVHDDLHDDPMIQALLALLANDPKVRKLKASKIKGGTQPIEEEEALHLDNVPMEDNEKLRAFVPENENEENVIEYIPNEDEEKADEIPKENAADYNEFEESNAFNADEEEPKEVQEEEPELDEVIEDPAVLQNGDDQAQPNEEEEKLNAYVPNDDGDEHFIMGNIVRRDTAEMPPHDMVIMLSFTTKCPESARKVTEKLMKKMVKIKEFRKRVWEKKVEYNKKETKANVKFLLHFQGSNIMECDDMKKCLEVLKAEEKLKGIKVEKYEYMDKSKENSEVSERGRGRGRKRGRGRGRGRGRARARGRGRGSESERARGRGRGRGKKRGRGRGNSETARGSERAKKRGRKRGRGRARGRGNEKV